MRIGSLAAATGVTTKTVRFYESEGLLPEPPRTPSGYRDYPRQTAGRLVFIRNAQAAGLSLTEIRGVLEIRDAGEPPCSHVGDLIEAHLGRIAERIAELTRAQESLRTLAQAAADTDPADCPEGAICRILTGRRPGTAAT